MSKEIRSLKIESVLYRALSRVLLEGRVLSKNIVISGVKLSKDMKKADVYVISSALSEDGSDINSLVKEMNQSSWLVRKTVSHYVNLRFMPELVFKVDLGFGNFTDVSRLLHSHIS